MGHDAGLHASLGTDEQDLDRGESLRGACVRRIEEDRAGFTLFPPLLLDEGSADNIYLRDLHGLDSLELSRYPGRPVWLLLKDPAVGSPLRFLPVDADSMRREWLLAE